MHLKEALAGALRGARAHQGLNYDELAGATHRTYVGMLEQARANPTLEKLDEIADHLGLDLLTMVTLAIAAQGEELLRRFCNVLPCKSGNSRCPEGGSW